MKVFIIEIANYGECDVPVAVIRNVNNVIERIITLDEVSDYLVKNSK